jgi:acetyl esterase/lipase
MRVLGLAAILVLLAVACGNDGSGEEAGESTTTTAPPVSTPSLATPLEVEVTEDVRYHDDIEGYREPLLDVYAPTEGGPWPVVVMFHEGGGLFENKDQWDLLAPLVAEQGAVVIAPTYGIEQPEDLSSFPVVEPSYFDVAPVERACVLAFVAETADDYGSDPTDVIAFGGSGGGSVAGRTVWDDNELDDGCLSQADPVVPHTLALVEPELMMSVSDAELATGRTDFDEGTAWDDLARSEDTEVHLLLGSEISLNHRFSVGDPYADEECGREIEPGTGLDFPGDGECVWWELRDPDRAFREDAERLGFFDDGWFYVGEQSLLLADRLEAEGQDPTVTTIEGLSHGIDREEATLLAPALIDIIQG